MNPAASWTQDELAILRTYYADEGGDVAKRLPGRPMGGILQKARQLGLYVSKERKRERLKAGQARRHGIESTPQTPVRMTTLHGDTFPSRSWPAKSDQGNAESLVGLPWMQWPTTEMGALVIADACDDGLCSANQLLLPGYDPDQQRFWSSLKGYMLALAARLHKDAA